MGTTAGAEKRRANQLRREHEWEDSIAEAARVEERQRIRRELLEWADDFMRRGAYMDSFREALDRILPGEE